MSNLPATTGTAPSSKVQRYRGTDRHLRYLAASIRLEESGPPRLAGATTMLVLALLIGLVAWSTQAHISSAALADGEVMPAGEVRAIQHLEGGIIRAIAVQEGEVVERGQVLVRLSPAATRSELAQLKARQASLSLRIARLRAFAEDRKPDFSAFAEHYPGMVEDQKAILDMQREAMASQRKVLEQQLEQRQIELRNLDNQLATVKESLRLLDEQAAMREDLVEKGLASRLSFLDTQRQLISARGQQVQVEGAISRAQEAMNETGSRLLELDARLKGEALNEMGELAAELSEVREGIAKIQDRLDRLDITAPVSGVVKDLRYHTIGGVIAPGAVIMELVPIDDDLVVQIRIDPADIGQVAVGQEVLIKVSAYEYARYGGIKGTLARISPSTIESEDGQTFYEGLVHLERNYVGEDPGNRILPGMTVNADIRTGQKTVFEYLIRPVHQGLERAFVEL